MAIDLDPMFHSLGVWGLWQISQICMIKASFFPSGFHLISIVFAGFEPPFHCNPPANYTGSFNDGNVGDNGTLLLGKCSIYDMASNETLPCENGHSYQYKGTTIVTEWDLVCDRDYLPSMAQTVLIGGQAVGATFFAGLADKFGRRPVFLVAHVFYFLTNFGMAFVPNVQVFIFLRFLAGYFQQGLVMITAVLSLELMPAGYRSELTVISGSFWGLQMCCLTLFGYFFRDQTWRHMQLALCLTSVVGIVNFLYTDESIRWLYVNNRIEEANKIVRKAARINKKKVYDVLGAIKDPMQMDLLPVFTVALQSDKNEINQETSGEFTKENVTTDGNIDANLPDDPIIKQATSDKLRETPMMPRLGVSSDKIEKKMTNDEVKQLVQSTHGEEKDVVMGDISSPMGESVDTGKYSVLDIYRHPLLRRTTLVMAYIWIVNSFVYFGLVMLSDTMSGDRFLNFFIGALVEFPAALAVYIGIKRFGRKPSLYVFQLTAGIALLLAVLLRVFVEPAPGIALTALSLLGKAAITSSFNTIFMYTPELYPTNLRSVGIGIASTSCRAGGMLAPFTRQLMKTMPWLPGTLFSVSALSAGLLVKLLVETRDKELPQNLEEMALWQKEQKNPRK